MIQSIWQKKIIFQFNIDALDVADQLKPLPLFLQLYWNHYIGFYFNQIQAFYSSWISYPFQKEQFYLTLNSQNLELNGTQIIGNLITLYQLCLQNPIKITCHFRNKITNPGIIQFKKHFKNNLKSSTCIRNSRFGASILTVQMSIQNIQQMFENYVKSQYKKYLGQQNFESQNLGYLFVVNKTQKIPIKIVSKLFTVERGVDKKVCLSYFLAETFGQIEENEKNEQKNEQKNKQKNEKKNEQKNEQNNEICQKKDQQQQLEKEPQGFPKGQKQLKKEMQQNNKKKGIKYNYIFQKYKLYINGVRITRGQYKIGFFDRFCHPDGYLYMIYVENV